MQGPEAGAALLAGCGGLICALTLGVLIGAVILRAAVSFYNKLAGGSGAGAPPPEYGQPGVGGEPLGTTPDPSNPFAAPQYQGSAAPASAPAIPVPDFGKAILIVFVTALINMAFGFVMGFAAGAVGAVGGVLPNRNEPNAGVIIVQLLQLPISFVVSAGVRTGMLPATFGKACLVTLIEYLIALAIAVVIGAVVFAVVMIVSLA